MVRPDPRVFIAAACVVRIGRHGNRRRPRDHWISSGSAGFCFCVEKHSLMHSLYIPAFVLPLKMLSSHKKHTHFAEYSKICYTEYVNYGRFAVYSNIMPLYVTRELLTVDENFFSRRRCRILRCGTVVWTNSSGSSYVWRSKWNPRRGRVIAPAVGSKRGAESAPRCQ